MGRAFLVIEIDHDKAGCEVREYGRPSDDTVAALLHELSASGGANFTFRASTVIPI